MHYDWPASADDREGNVHQPTVGSAFSTHQPTVGSAISTRQPTVGSAFSTRQPTVGWVISTRQPTVRSAIFILQTLNSGSTLHLDSMFVHYFFSL